MADWLQPTIDSLKVDVLDILKLRDIDAITLAEGPVNPPVGAKRWNHTAKTFQEWSGTAWVDLVIALAGGGTGGTGAGGAFGTMAYQNSNTVNITGGTIVENAIADTPANILARNAVNEVITGLWTYQTAVHVNGSIRIRPDQVSAGLERISLADATNSSCPAYIQAYEPGIAYSNFIIGNNYYGADGATSTRRNPATAGSFLRLGQPTTHLIGIDAAGTQIPYLSTQPGYVSAQQANLQIGTNSGTTYLQFLSNNLSYIEFRTSAGITGTISHGNSNTYYDATSHNFRANDSATLATLSNAGGLIIAAGSSSISTQFIRNYGNNAIGITLVPGVTTIYGDTVRFDRAFADVSNSMVWSGNILKLENGGAVLSVAGVPGVGIRIYKLGTSAMFCTHQAGGSTQIYNAEGTTQLMQILSENGGTIAPNGGLKVPNGTATLAAVRFSGSPHSGMYFNGTNATTEFGGAFDHAGIAAMRCFGGQSKLDFLCGSQIIATFGPYPNTRFNAYVSPSAANTFYCAEPSLAWYQVTSLNGVNVTSDIRTKDVRGPIPDNVLDLIESVDPLITSFKESEYNKDGPISREEFFHNFPSFSAQDIREKIDGPLGTRITFGDEKLGIVYERLTPLLWAAIRRLNARLKALEEN